MKKVFLRIILILFLIILLLNNTASVFAAKIYTNDIKVGDILEVYELVEVING